MLTNPNNTDSVKVVRPTKYMTTALLLEESLLGGSVEMLAANAIARGISFCSKFPMNR